MRRKERKWFGWLAWEHLGSSYRPPVSPSWPQAHSESGHALTHSPWDQGFWPVSARSLPPGANSLASLASATLDSSQIPTLPTTSLPRPD